MKITFVYPIYLTLLVLLPTAAGIAWLARRGGGELRHWLSLALRIILMAAIILALAGVQVRFRSDLLTTVFVLDASDSLSPDEVARGEDFIKNAIAGMEETRENNQAAIVVFGADALVERLASDDQGLGDLTSAPVTTRTDIESALQLAQAILPAEGAKRLVLLSDGRENLGQALRQAELAALSEVELLYVPLGAENAQVEALIDSLEAPAEARLGERFDLVVTVESTASINAELRIFEDDRLLQSQEVALQPGANRILIPVSAGDEQAGSGFRRFRAQLIPDQDNRLQNNEASAFTVIYGPPNILIVEDDPTESENLARALTAAQMHVTRVPPAEIPTTLPELAAYDSVVLANVPAAGLPAGAMEALPVYIRDLGRGVVMIGGETSFGAGGYLRTPLEAALPVDMDVRDRELQANLALVMAVDKSGSMGRCHCDNPDLNQTYTRREVGQPKVDIAKEAIMRASAALGNQDYLGVVAFDTQPRWVLELSKTHDPAQLEQAISAFQAEGSTNLQNGVVAAYNALKDVQARRKHIILMTDGWVRTGELTGLAQEMKEQGITLSVVAAGEGAAEYLGALANLGGGTFYPATDIFKVPEFFLKETIKSVGEYIIEEDFYPLPSAPGPALSGLDTTNLPPLRGYNGSTPKSTARLDLLTTRGDPLLATWQYGLGRSAVWTSDMKGQWGSEWIKWNAYPRFAAQLVRWTLPTPKVEGMEASARLKDGRAQIDVQAVDETGQPLNYLQGSAVIIGPDLQPREAQIEQVGPGKYQATADLAAPGAYLVRLGVNRGDQSLGQTTLGLVVPYSPEYKNFGVDRRLLGELAETTGGGVLTNAKDAFLHNLPAAEQAREFWWQLLLLAALMFPIDVMLRRLALSRRDWALARAWISNNLRRRPADAEVQERPVVLGQLFQARDRARHRREDAASPRAAPRTPPPGEAPSIPPASPPAANKPADSTPDPGDSLARLREAKKRARKE